MPWSYVPVKISLRRPSALKLSVRSTNLKTDWWQRWGGRVGLLGAIAGAGWAAFQFIYKEWYLPNSSPGLVQTDVSTRYLGEIECCRIHEVVTTVENKSGREVVLHASHQTIGARKQAISHFPDSDEKRREVTDAFVRSRSANGTNFQYILDHNAQYVGVSLDRVPLLLAAGNIAGPGGYLSEGEKHVHRAVALVPKEYVVFSVRGLMHISNTQFAEALHWHWVIEPLSLRPMSIPWRADNVEMYRAQASCLKRPDCEKTFREETYRLQQSYMRNDKRNFSVTWAADFASVDGK